jgi:hypothetical protein
LLWKEIRTQPQGLSQIRPGLVGRKDKRQSPPTKGPGLEGYTLSVCHKKVWRSGRAKADRSGKRLGPKWRKASRVEKFPFDDFLPGAGIGFIKEKQNPFLLRAMVRTLPWVSMVPFFSAEHKFILTVDCEVPAALTLQKRRAKNIQSISLQIQIQILNSCSWFNVGHRLNSTIY